MAITLTTAARNAACDAVVDLIDAGAGPGILRLLDAGATVLATFTFSDPAYSAAVVGVATMLSPPKFSAAAAASGDAATFRILDSTATEVDRGIVSVVAGGGDLEMDSVSIVAGEILTLQFATHTQPA